MKNNKMKQGLALHEKVGLSVIAATTAGAILLNGAKVPDQEANAEVELAEVLNEDLCEIYRVTDQVLSSIRDGATTPSSQLEGEMHEFVFDPQTWSTFTLVAPDLVITGTGWDSSKNRLELTREGELQHSIPSSLCLIESLRVRNQLAHLQEEAIR